MPVETELRSARATATSYLPPLSRRTLFSRSDDPRRQPSRRDGDANVSALRILVAEDETLVALVTQSILRSAGHNPVALAANGEEAVWLALRHRPDVILMDIRLREPQPDGIQAVAEIREKLDCVVIYVTAYSDLNTVARAAATAPEGYLKKPYSDQQLLEAIDAAVRKRRRGGREDAEPDGE